MDNKLRKLITAFFDFIHIEIQKQFVDNLIEFVKFGIIGVTNTLISYMVNVFVLFVMRSFNVTWDFIAGNMVAFILSVLWSFYWNNRFVFMVQEGENRSIWKALLKTYIAYGFTGIILNNALSWLWINWFGVSKYIAPMINLIISVPINFLINKLWAFKPDK